jgi:RNA polymerase sigma factor (sigma-70 family)
MPLLGEVEARTPTALSDAALVEAAQLGDRTAFAELFDRHRPLLVALCRRVLGGSQAVEDVVQEAAMAALLGIPSLREPDRFGQWLAGIGLNISRRWFRASRSEAWSWQAVTGGGFVDRWNDPPLDPSEVVAERELARRVRDAVADLPPGQRDATLLFYFAGLTYREMAALLGVEVSAVKARLHKARAGLRRRLYSLWKEDTMGEQRGLIEMRTAEVLRLPAEGERPPEFVVVLEEVAGDRRLPIWVGQSEATWLALALEEVELPRPGPYAMVAGLLGSLGSRIREARIDRLAGATYYATLVAEREGTTASIDARPSDALNLAALTGSPVLAAEDILPGPGDASAAPEYARLERHLDEGTAEVTAAIASDAREEWERSLEEFSRQENT